MFHTLAVSAYEASLLQAVVVIPVPVVVHLHTVLFGNIARVEGSIWLSLCPVDKTQRCLIRPGPANCKSNHIHQTMTEVGALMSKL